MAAGMAEREELITLLAAVCCAEDEARRIGACIRAGELDAARRLLRRRRHVLLADLHQSQQQIDCLDFMVYQIDRLQNHI